MKVETVDATAFRALQHRYQSEKAFQAQIEHAARFLGWACYHPFDSRRSAAGWPDLVCVREGEMVALELKTERGRVRPEQEAWIELLDSVPGVTAMIVRPDDWPSVMAALGGDA